MSYGERLPDQINRIANLSDAQLELIGDIRDLYKERVALEREYAGKLQLLARKAAERKNKRIASLVVGDEPSKLWGQETLRKSTLDSAYEQLIASNETTAQDHITLADGLTSQVTDALKALAAKHEEMKKKQMTFYQRILNDRDKYYNDRIKTKQKYDEECLEVEGYRQKQGRAHDDKHATRAAKQYIQQQIDMQNSKNSYIISIAISNKMKKKFYSSDLPTLENQFQYTQKSLLSGLRSLIQLASNLHLKHFVALQSRVSSLQNAFSQLDIQKDQTLFMDYNIRAFTEPADWDFEPCSGFYEKSDIVVEPEPKIFLQNKLSRSKAKLEEIAPLIQKKQSEVERWTKVTSAYTDDRSLGDADGATNDCIEASHELTLLSTSEAVLTAEIETIAGALKGDEGGKQPHTFKPASFSIPTTCGHCKSSIWGLSKQGKTCKACGISVHSKCELKVPADCSASRQAKNVSTLKHTPSTMTSRTASIPSVSSLSRSHGHNDELSAYSRVVYDFTPTSPFELAVSEGSNVQILEEDDGTGWVKVADEHGGRGLVPASYVEPVESSEAKSPLPPKSPAANAVSPPKSLGSGKYVKGVYDYQANGEDELNISEGDLIELSAGPQGGENYAEGWWEGYDGTGKKGVFPSNYVEHV